MVTKDEALKEAYETLKDIAENATSYEDGWCGAEAEKVLPVIEKALAQPAQEPDRQTLQANGTHPAPCARHCEATAFNIVIRNLEKRLQQPAQKPVYLVWFDEEMNRGWSETTKDHYEITDDEDRWLLYTTPPQRPWVGLTNNDWNSTAYDTEFRAGAEWAEAKLKEKNS